MTGAPTRSWIVVNFDAFVECLQLAGYRPTWSAHDDPRRLLIALQNGRSIRDDNSKKSATFRFYALPGDAELKMR